MVRVGLPLFVALAIAWFAPGRARAQAVPGALLGVAAARRGETLALRTARAVLVSRDDGASFPEALHPPAGATGLRDVAVDDDGTLLVRWSNSVGDAPVELVLPSGARTFVPARGVLAIAAGGGTRAFATEDALFVSHGGRPFVAISHAPACAECEAMVGSVALGIDAHGEVVLTDVEVNTCGSSDRVDWLRVGHVARGATEVAWASLRLPSDEGGALLRPGVFGWAYGVTARGTVWARSADESRAVSGLETGAAYEPIEVATNGRITLALWHGTLVQLRGARAIVLDADAGDVAALAVDARGRALAVDASGALVRFRRGRGWEALPAALEASAAWTAADAAASSTEPPRARRAAMAHQSCG